MWLQDRLARLLRTQEQNKKEELCLNSLQDLYRHNFQDKLNKDLQ